MAKRVPAPSWHLPQVLGRFFGFTMLLASLEGRMLCTPWQLAQLATVCGAALGGQSVEGGVEAHQPVAGHAEFAGQTDVAVAASAGVADVADIHRTCGVGVFEDLVLAMAIGAERRLGDAAGQRLAVHTGAELVYHVGVAHAARIGHRGPERLGFRGEQFVSAAMA